MPNENAWSVIAAPTSNSLILCVDFPSAGRREADFAELAEKMGPAWSGHGLLHTTPAPVRLSDLAAGASYTDHWMQARDWGKYEVVAVVGYCVGAVFAAQIAEDLARHQATPPKAVLFDPQVADLQLIESELHKMIAQAGPVLTTEEAEQGRKRAAEIVGTPSISMADATVQIVALYRDMVSAAFQRIGLAESRKEEVVLLFESYLTWFAAAYRIDPSRVWSEALSLTSTDYAELEKSGVTMVANARKMLGRHIPLDTTHADLLRDDSTVRTLLDNAEF